MELPVYEASLEIVNKGGDFILMLSKIAGIVLLKSRQKYWCCSEEVCGHYHVSAGYWE